MENKKLINILARDMGELEELIAEMKTNKKFDVLEMEFIHTRAKGVLQLLQMLNAGEGPVMPAAGEGNEILEKLKDNVQKVSQITSEIKTETSEQKKPEEESRKEQKEQPLPGVIPEPPGHQEEESPQEREEEEMHASEQDDDDGNMLQEEIVKPEAMGRLGDSFLKSKSVNDLITDQVKLEFKLSNRPVTSIQSAIGINDRFQYIRELFDGNNQKFLETVKTLDSMDNIRQAIDYLRIHFKWKKNETSLKFVNLVKRRFQE